MLVKIILWLCAIKEFNPIFDENMLDRFDIATLKQKFYLFFTEFLQNSANIIPLYVFAFIPSLIFGWELAYYKYL